MFLAAILTIISVPQNGNVAKAEADAAPVVSSVTSESPSLSQPLPSAPEPKIKADEDAAFGADAALGTTSATPAPAGAVPAIEPGYTPGTPATPSFSLTPAKPFVGRSDESATQRKLWYMLSFTGAGAATFDAWSTRRVISEGYGVEGNPLLRPFSHSGLLYAATQVSPLVMDYLGKRMMGSQHRKLRKMWWLPQAAGTSASLTAAIHNVRMVP